MKVTTEETPIQPKVTTTYTLSEITEDELCLIYSLLIAVNHGDSGKWGTIANSMKGYCIGTKPFLNTEPLYIKIIG